MPPCFSRVDFKNGLERPSEPRIVDRLHLPTQAGEPFRTVLVDNRIAELDAPPDKKSKLRFTGARAKPIHLPRNGDHGGAVGLLPRHGQAQDREQPVRYLVQLLRRRLARRRMCRCPGHRVRSSRCIREAIVTARGDGKACLAFRCELDVKCEPLQRQLDWPAALSAS